VRLLPKHVDIRGVVISGVDLSVGFCLTGKAPELCSQLAVSKGLKTTSATPPIQATKTHSRLDSSVRIDT
jgi:hypothetical protein